MVEPEKAPPLSVKGPMPVLLLALLPICATSETRLGLPVEDGAGVTLMVKGTELPCVIAVVGKPLSVVVVPTKVDFQFCTRL